MPVMQAASMLACGNMTNGMAKEAILMQMVCCMFAHFIFALQQTALPLISLQHKCYGAMAHINVQT